MSNKPYKKQIKGSHYLDFVIQPAEFINKNRLLSAEGNVIKYILRHPYKGKKDDLLKAKHYIDMIIDRANFTYIEKFDSLEKAANANEEGELVEVKVKNINFDFTTVKMEKKDERVKDSSAKVQGSSTKKT